MLYKLVLSLCIVAASAFQGPAASKLGMSSFVSRAAAAPARFAAPRAGARAEETVPDAATRIFPRRPPPRSHADRTTPRCPCARFEPVSAAAPAAVSPLSVPAALSVPIGSEARLPN